MLWSLQLMVTADGFLGRSGLTCCRACTIQPQGLGFRSNDDTCAVVTGSADGFLGLHILPHMLQRLRHANSSQNIIAAAVVGLDSCGVILRDARCMLQRKHSPRASQTMMPLVLWSLQLPGTADGFLGGSGLPHMLQGLQHADSSQNRIAAAVAVLDLCDILPHDARCMLQRTHSPRASQAMMTLVLWSR